MCNMINGGIKWHTKVCNFMTTDVKNVRFFTKIGWLQKPPIKNINLNFCVSLTPFYVNFYANFLIINE